MRMLLTATLTPCAAMAADADIGASGDAMLPPPTPLTAAQTLYLDVTLNQTPRGLLPFTELQGRLMAAGATLRQLGFPARGEDPVALDQLGGVVVRNATLLQTLALDVPLEQLSLPTTRLERPTETATAAAAATATAAGEAKAAATEAAAHASDATADAAQKVADKARDVADDANKNANEAKR